MSQLKMHSKDLTQDNITKIQALFPHCVTETKGEDGKLRLSVDFDLLRQELSGELVEGPQERFRLDWPGKREAMLLANSPIAKTLRPARDESVDFDTTENLFIEGDNLDALKLLQENYLGKVKMIYIDPPYNTGNDFVYNDDFAESSEEYLERSLQKDEDGNRLVTNRETNGRFHSDWLSMMLPRLRLARNLLSDDGVIFISIDDNEHTTLKNACDEIFGKSNFVANLIWKRRASSALADNNVSIDHEYVFCYQKGRLTDFLGVPKDFNNYSNPDNDPRGDWVAGDLTVGMNSSQRPNQAYDLIDPKTGNIFPFNPNRVWAYIPKNMEILIKEGRVIFPASTDRRPMLKRFKNELKSINNPFSSLMLNNVGLNTEATKLMQRLMQGAFFDYSKPLSLINTLLLQVTNQYDIILDFFAGSSTTAHAVMQLNAEDGGNRKFIMVQLPEEVEEKHEAYKAGYKTITEISKERIRRAGKQILEGECHEDWNKDVGFRVLKVDSTNMKDVYYRPSEQGQSDLINSISPIKEGRSSEDLLFQVMLDLGLELNLPIRSEIIEDKEVFFVDEDLLIACFEEDISEKLILDLTELQPLRVVFADNCFGSNDSLKTNAKQIFKQRSPDTTVMGFF